MRILIVRTVSAPVAAAIASVLQKVIGKDHQAGFEIEVDAFDQLRRRFLLI